MNVQNFLIVSAGALLALASRADQAIPQPQIDSRAATSATAEVERAITQFIGACLARDEQRLNEITTDDMRIEYALEIPETYYAVGSASVASDCPMTGDVRLQLSNLRIYPTADEQAVFVQYELAGSSVSTLPQEQLALVELRDNRIARIVNFADPNNVIVTARRPSRQLPAAVAQRGVR